LLKALDAAITALEAGEIETRARLLALAAAVRIMGHAGKEHGV
jgi:hypothetical protein